MPVNPDDYVCTPNPWFETEVTYEGQGYAEFEKPAGWIKGSTKVQFDETGHEFIEMHVDDFYCDEPLGTEYPYHDDLTWLLNGVKPHIEGNLVMHLGGLNPKNGCKALKVTTCVGTFEPIGEILYNQAFLSDSHTVRFYVLRSKFDLASSGEAKYWVMPLSNFLSEGLRFISTFGRHILNQHPLRIYPTPPVSQDLPVEEQREALHYANSWNCFIPFKYEETLGFIERLLDYEERSRKLLSGEARLLTTSVMVGECVGRSIEFDDATKWIPLEFLHMLSLASGSLVGIPWIEFRDSNNRLVRRLHTRQWQAPFHKGHIALDGFAKGGIAWLLSNAPTKLDAHLRTAIHLIVKGSQDAFYTDDQLVFLFRAADTLSKDYRTQATISSVVEIDGIRKKEIKEIVREAGKKIKEVGLGATGDEANEIDRIAQTVFGAMNQSPKKPDEALAMLILLENCGLKDKEVIPDTEKWIRRFNMYRNQVIHESYFELTSGVHDPDEFIALRDHLHDILLRVVLKRLNYDGEYKRAIRIRENVSVDWVQPGMPADELGYKSNSF